jgi:hypothetical protein
MVGLVYRGSTQAGAETRLSRIDTVIIEVSRSCECQIATRSVFGALERVAGRADHSTIDELR